MARKCSKCGEIVEDDSLFCPECQNYTQKIVNDRKYPVKWIALALIIVIVLVVVILGLGAVVLSKTVFNKDADTKEEKMDNDEFR